MNGLPLYSHDDFIRAYYNALPHHKRYEDAYWYVEELYNQKYGKNKYSSYVVFRATLSRWVKCNTP